MAGEPWTAVKEYIYSDGGFLRLATALVTSGAAGTTLDSLGATKIDFVGTVSNQPTYAGATSTDTAYFETKLSTGVTLKIVNTANTVNAQTGYKMSADSKSIDKFESTITLGFTDYQTLLAAYRDGLPVVAVRALGLQAEDGTSVGYEHLIGKITEFTPTTKEGLMECKIVITGGTAYAIKETVPDTPDWDETDYNTLLTGASNKIEPIGQDLAGGYTIKDLTSGELTTLLTGKILQTAAS